MGVILSIAVPTAAASIPTRVMRITGYLLLLHIRRTTLATCLLSCEVHLSLPLLTRFHLSRLYQRFTLSELIVSQLFPRKDLVHSDRLSRELQAILLQ
jgi:hypothetical protein